MTFGQYPCWEMLIDRMELCRRIESSGGSLRDVPEFNVRFNEELVGYYRILDSNELEVDNSVFDKVIRATCIVLNWVVHCQVIGTNERLFAEVCELVKNDCKPRKFCEVEELSIDEVKRNAERDGLVDELSCCHIGNN